MVTVHHCDSLPVTEHVHVWHFPSAPACSPGFASRGKAFLFSTGNALWVHTGLTPHPHTSSPASPPYSFIFLGCGLMPWETSWPLSEGSWKGLEMLSGLMLPDLTDGLKPSEERPQR